MIATFLHHGSICCVPEPVSDGYTGKAPAQPAIVFNHSPINCFPIQAHLLCPITETKLMY